MSLSKTFTRNLLLAIALTIAALAVAIQVAPNIAALPIALFAYIFLFSRLNVEQTRVPIHHVILTFLFGAIVATLGSIASQVAFGLILRLFLEGDNIAYANRIFGSSITEEILKALPLLFVYYRGRQSFGVTHGLVYAAAAGFGFALFEQIFFSIGYDPTQGPNPFWLRPTGGFWTNTVYFGLSHGLYTGLTALGCAWGRMSDTESGQRFFPLIGLFTAIVFHGLYNGAGIYDALRNDGQLFMLIIVYVVMLVVCIATYLQTLRKRATVISDTET